MGALSGAAAVAAIVVALPLPRRVLFCSEIVNPYGLADKPCVVTVGANEHARYDSDFAAFGRSRGLSVVAAERPMREMDGGASYVGLTAQACDGLTYVWSENVATADEFVVTFHYNRLWSSRAMKEAKQARAAFLAEFASRYRVGAEDPPYRLPCPSAGGFSDRVGSHRSELRSESRRNSAGSAISSAGAGLSLNTTPGANDDDNFDRISGAGKP
jgi:hypothetical protein